MFVSGWQGAATRGLTVLLSLFLMTMLAGSLLVRDGEAVQPLGFLFGAIAFAVSTAASLRWEKVYRDELGQGEGK